MTLYYEWNHLKQNNETDTEEVRYDFVTFIQKQETNNLKKIFLHLIYRKLCFSSRKSKKTCSRFGKNQSSKKLRNSLTRESPTNKTRINNEEI